MVVDMNDNMLLYLVYVLAAHPSDFTVVLCRVEVPVRVRAPKCPVSLTGSIRLVDVRAHVCSLIITESWAVPVRVGSEFGKLSYYTIGNDEYRVFRLEQKNMRR